MTQQIKISDRNWRALNAMKNPGESFDDVVERLVDEHDYMAFVGGEPHE